MQLSKRENHLLELLIKNDMTLTAQELASFAHVSTKTIYRTIKRINDEFPSGDIIISEVGRGFRLDYENYLRESREGNVERMDEARNRRNNILLTLLFKSPNSVSISELFEPYFVTETVIIQDLKKMQSFLRTYQLEIRKKKQRLSILGGEKNIRKTVNYLIGQENLINDTFLADAKNVNAYDIDYITSLLEFIEKKLNTMISYPYNINIFSHLYILLKRSREGAISKKIDNTLDASEKKLIVKYQSLYDVSVEVVQRMSGYLGTALAEIESFFLFQYLLSSRLESYYTNVIAKEEEAIELTAFFMEEMRQLIGTEIDIDEYQEDLISHIAPLLYRLKNEIVIKNELLKDIRLEYQSMFQFVSQVSRKAEQTFQLSTISDDEIGFLVLYFVRYKEIQKRKKRILIMCSSGVGTSELLKVKVRKAFPDLEIVDVLSSKKFSKNLEQYEDIDLILTTIHFTSPTTIPTILVNSVFTKQDEERTKKILGGMSNGSTFNRKFQHS